MSLLEELARLGILGYGEQPQGILASKAPQGILGPAPKPVGLLGSLYANHPMMRQAQSYRGTNPRPDVTDIFGYGPSWETYGQNFAKNAQSHLPQEGDDMSQWVNKMAGILGIGGMTAYHGSPHNFTKFDMGKVGSGEGSQAFGHGLYLAENKAVAKEYAKVAGPKGNLYKVDLPDDQIAKMIDWDKPLKDQPQLQAIADKLGVKARVNMAGRPDLGEFNFVDSTGEDLVEAAIAKLGKEKASVFLKQHGIPGIKYLDQGSRTGGKGTSNFVVFDDQIPKILGNE